jgi:HD-GYP domain-containing protein (c-di-GMP phosphodiesterase class II)
MSSAAADISLTLPAEADPAAILSKLVTTDVNTLVVGRTLRYPIYGDNGEMLLAEKAVITEEFAQRLKQRAIQTVQVHSDDLGRITFRPLDAASIQNVQLDLAISQQIDSIIDDGLLFVANSEPAVLTQMEWHGKNGYNRQRYLDRINRNKETSVFVDNLMRNALQGKRIDCGEVTRLTAGFLNDITGDVDGSLASAIDSVGQTAVADHSVKMTLQGMAMGVAMGLDPPNVRTIGLAALVHDWGMAQVPRHIVDAPRWLTEEERYEIQKHPIYTMRLLDKICGVPQVVPLIAYQVHERPNGSGYPQRRSGDRIHQLAAILGVADAYCAMVAPRPFRPPLIPHAAITCLIRHAAIGNFDPQAVRALLKVQSLFAIGSLVTLSDGSVGRVLRSNGDKYAQPIVRVLQDNEGHPLPEESKAAIIDLAEEGIDVVQALPAPGSHATNLTPEIFGMGAPLPAR